MIRYKYKDVSIALRNIRPGDGDGVPGEWICEVRPRGGGSPAWVVRVEAESVARAARIAYGKYHGTGK